MRYYCNICKKTISEDVFNYSMKVYRKPLCITHQKQDKTPSYNNTSYSNKSSHKPYTKSKSTPQAMALYDALRKRRISCKLEAYDGYKHVDISIEWANVNIEIDGKHHIYNPKQLYADIERDTGSQDEGIITIRIPNSAIEEDVNAVADSIAKVVRKRHREDSLW